MTISTNISFHGVARVQIGKISNLSRDGKPWQCFTISLYDADDEPVQSVQIHAPNNVPLIIQEEEERRAA